MTLTPPDPPERPDHQPDAVRRAPHVDAGVSRYAELYRRAAERARFGHAELVPGAHPAGEAELRRYVGQVIRERGTAARLGPEHLVATYLAGLLVSPERWALVWTRAMVGAVAAEQRADRLAEEARRRWAEGEP